MGRDELDRRLKAALERGPMTKEEIDAQRRSFVRAEAGFGSDKDEAKYAAAVRAGDTETIARLDREAEERVAAVDRHFVTTNTDCEICYGSGVAEIWVHPPGPFVCRSLEVLLKAFAVQRTLGSGLVETTWPCLECHEDAASD